MAGMIKIVLPNVQRTVFMVLVISLQGTVKVAKPITREVSVMYVKMDNLEIAVTYLVHLTVRTISVTVKVVIVILA